MALATVLLMLLGIAVPVVGSKMMDHESKLASHETSLGHIEATLIRIERKIDNIPKEKP